MKTSCTPVSDLMLGPFQACFPTACFLMGSLEREQWLNLEGSTPTGFKRAWRNIRQPTQVRTRSRPSLSPGFCERTSS